MQTVEQSESQRTTVAPLMRRDGSDLRAMKRALANAPLGPKAVLALSSAIIAIESDLTEATVRRELSPRK